MKHGPIALIDEEMPVVAIAPHDARLREDAVQHRGGEGALGNRHRRHRRARTRTWTAKADAVIVVPRTHELLSPLLMVLPLQLLAYHIALLRGCDVDQPRNLAKSVTVE